MTNRCLENMTLKHKNIKSNIVVLW